ncbi:hypothetical protein FS837_007283 [Tulasnella sp. UAMH 9824]|nr:hypothetical protein FS837_007283 [Tulasnella sp. UAMH 9824]
MWRFKQIARFISVCTFWKELLENASVFWPKLHSAYPPETLELIISRNVSAPLRVSCSAKEEARTKLDLLELATKHSTRWSSLKFEGVICDVVKEQLQTHTGNIAELCVLNTQSTVGGLVTLSIPDGRPIHHLALDGVKIPWDMSRLRGVRSLQLSRILWNPPSMTQLRMVLASSPGLQYLRLFKIGDLLEFHSGDSSSMLFLPELSTLILQDLSERSISHLLTHIQAPACRCIIAADIPFSIASDPAFTDLIAPAFRTSSRMTLSSSGASIFIHSAPAPRVTLAWNRSMKEPVGINIRMRRNRSGVTSKEDVQSALQNTVVAHGPRSLAVTFIKSLSEVTIITAAEVLQLLPSTNAIAVKPDVDCQNIMTYLITGDGEASGFPCPDLEILNLTPKKDEEVELIKTFLRLHQKSVQESAGAPVRPLKRLLLPQNILDILEIDGLLEGLEARCPS